MAGLLKVLFTQLIVIYDFKKIWYDKIFKTIFKLMIRKKYALNKNLKIAKMKKKKVTLNSCDNIFKTLVLPEEKCSYHSSYITNLKRTAIM